MKFRKLDPFWLEVINKKYSQYSPINDFSPLGDNKPSKISWAMARKIVLDRDQYRCRICGKSSLNEEYQNFSKLKLDVEVHHIIPRKLGGSDSFENLITLCHSCHVSTFANEYSGIPVPRDGIYFEFFTDIKNIYEKFPDREEILIKEYFLNGRILRSEVGINGYLCMGNNNIEIDEIISVFNPDLIILKNPKNNKFIRGYLSP